MPEIVFDPNIVYFVLVLSLWIGMTAVYIPGTGVIEVLALGGLAGSMYLLFNMPTVWWAVVLLVLGVFTFVAVPFLQQRLAPFAVVGLILQGVGSFFLFEDGSVSLIVIVLALAVQFVYHTFVLMPMLKRIRSLPNSDKDDLLVGMQGRVVKGLAPIGTVLVNSELWTATSNQNVEPGTPVIVVERSGLQLYVEPTKDKRMPEIDYHRDNGSI